MLKILFLVASPWPHFGTTPLWEACRTSSNKISSFPTFPRLCSLSCHVSLTSGEMPVKTNSCSGRSLSSTVSHCLQSTEGLSPAGATFLAPQDCPYLPHINYLRPECRGSTTISAGLLVPVCLVVGRERGWGSLQ